MKHWTRRALMSAAGALFAMSGLRSRASAQALSKQPVKTNREPGVFGFEDVLKRARTIADAPFNPVLAPLPEALAQLDFDHWRAIRFRAEASPLAQDGGKFQLQLFHLGHLFQRAVAVNIVKDGVSAPLLNIAKLFDYGANKFAKPLPENLGAAGFRLHYPVNDPRRMDEFVSFLGASYFRFLGRGQKYGLSARGLSIGTGRLDNKEEFPFFREFWIESPAAGASHVLVNALLDSPSLAGAYRFNFVPGANTYADVTVTLFPRKRLAQVGVAPLTSMFFLGENDRHLNDRNKYDEFRPELHDSDGLLIHTADNEWIWRPLRNPLVQEVHRFHVTDVRGFGLLQRDREFAHYQDIELNYEERPSYWIEPQDEWGEGDVELVELATKGETFDNIIVAFVPKDPIETDTPSSYTYRMSAMSDGLSLHSLGYVKNTFTAPATALGANEAVANNTRRFMIDFVGGDLAFFLADPGPVELVATATNGKVFRQFLVANPAISGFRAMIDVELRSNEITGMTCKLKKGPVVLTETWAYSWKTYNF